MLKKLAVIILLALVAPLTVSAQERIAVMDLGRVLVDSPAMQDIDKQLKAKDDALRADAKAKQTSFGERQTTLNQQRAILPPEQFSQKQRELATEMREYESEFKAKLRQLAASRNLAISKIEDKMEPIVKKVVNEVGASVLVEKKQVIFAAKELNITARVSQLLNQSLKSMKLEMVPLKK